MGISFEGKSDEELIAIARDPNTPSGVLADLQQWLYKGGIAKIRLRNTYKSGLEIRFIIDEAIAENPNTNPTQLWGMLEDNSKNILNNPALPLLVLEHPTVFSHRNFSLLLDNIPKFVLDVMLSNAQNDSEVMWEIQSHIGYAGEVQSNEDYTQGLYFLAKLPTEDKYLKQLREDNAFPRFLVLNDESVWSPQEVLSEVTRCRKNLNRQQWNETHAIFNTMKGSFANTGLNDIVAILEARFKYSKDNILISFLENIYKEVMYDEYDDAGIDIANEHSNILRFSISLNPLTSNRNLAVLSSDTNRYIRATAQEALEMRCN
jgi:hypothetical protein